MAVLFTMGLVVRLFCNSSALAIHKAAPAVLSTASQLPLLIRRRSLSRYNQPKIRASTIFDCSHRLAELLRYFWGLFNFLLN